MRLHHRFPAAFMTVAVALTAAGGGWLSVVSRNAVQTAEHARDHSLRLEESHGSIAHLDEVLTMSARMAAATGDPKWEQRYRRFEPELDAAIKATAAMVSGRQSAAAGQTDAANQRLVAMENEAFALVRLGQTREAGNLLGSREYEAQKRIYAAGMEALAEAAHAHLDAELHAARQQTLLATRLTLAGMAAGLLLWSLVIASITGWRREQAATNEALQAENAERKRAELAARDEQRFANDVISALPGTFSLIEPTGQYLRWNARVRILIGVSDDQMPQANAFDAFEPADRPRVAEKLREAMQQGFSRYETNVTTRGVTARYVFQSTRVDSSRGTHLIVLGTNVTCQRAAEESLRQAYGELKVANQRNRVAGAVIASTAEGVMVTDAQLRIESVNPAFERITGYSAAEAVGRTPKILFSGKHDEAFFHRLQETVDTQGLWHGEIWNRRHDGTLYPQDSSFTVLRDAEGRITHYAAVFSDDTVRHRLEERLRELSSTDGLTGIANRRAFDRVLAREWARAMRDGRPLSLLMADIDRFKKYNDRYGHPEGDRCLQRVAQALRQAAYRASDVAARYGGEEFAVILPGADTATATAMGERIRAAVAALNIPHADSDAAAWVTLSVGAATATPAPAARPSDLVGAADGALYVAKQAGRNRVALAPDPVSHPMTSVGGA